ncbi:hypothetical protein KSP40_PGU007807 [Platanthera guangdongensis]|uniref:Uncharacterized protein n=1 Tax=Platanthera guangdongensis TaxID=2320717 RepID=A0ABR2LXN1_9ASPA
MDQICIDQRRMRALQNNLDGTTVSYHIYNAIMSRAACAGSTVLSRFGKDLNRLQKAACAGSTVLSRFGKDLNRLQKELPSESLCHLLSQWSLHVEEMIELKTTVCRCFLITESRRLGHNTPHVPTSPPRESQPCLPLLLVSNTVGGVGGFWQGSWCPPGSSGGRTPWGRWSGLLPMSERTTPLWKVTGKGSRNRFEKAHWRGGQSLVVAHGGG